MNSRRFSKNLKKSDLLNHLKLYEDENNILKKEIAVLNSLIKSQEERYHAELDSLTEENNSLKAQNSDFLNKIKELKDTLTPLTKERCAQNLNPFKQLDKNGGFTSRDSVSKKCRDHENSCYKEHSIQSSKILKTYSKVSPLRAQLIEDSKKISKLVTKIRKFKNPR